MYHQRYLTEHRLGEMRWPRQVAWVSVFAMLSSDARDALDELLAREDPSIIGLVLSGSAARGGMATERSDVDVFVVRDTEGGHATSRSPAIDEIPISMDELQDVAPYRRADRHLRWSFAYAQVLREYTQGPDR